MDAGSVRRNFGFCLGAARQSEKATGNEG
jgi:hypothetical protein